MPTREGLSGRAWWAATLAVLAVSLVATVPTAGDIGLTWDEPSYRTSQVVSAQWWEGLARARGRSDLDALLSADALLFYWPYARYGYNFHPPLAGQLNLLTHAIFGGWMKDIPSRRLASIFEYSAAIALAFGFLARRYGPWVGGVAAGSLLLMPRVHGDGLIAGTDTPGLLLWAVTALAFWKGLHEPGARRWRVVVGVALGLGFVEKMAAIVVLGPILAWLVLARLTRTFGTKGGRADWVDGVVTSSLMLAPIGLAFREVVRLARLLPPPDEVNLFTMHPPAAFPGVILLAPLAVWILRRLAGRVAQAHPIWGVERPALETWTAILAFAPAIGWLGNPAWWRETLPRMAHYYQLNADRRGALPDIRILYSGEIYVYSLPWHNAWVLIAITVPAGILLASVVGLGSSLIRGLRGRDALPRFFALNLIFLPALRMLPTPAHDGVRLLLPTFFFLAAFAGWGVVAIGDRAGRIIGAGRHGRLGRALVATLVLGPAAWQLARIHPFELSYYNEFIGGPRGASRAGFELSYWYDAFNGESLPEINRTLPDGAAVSFFNELINTPTPDCLQELGQLKGSLTLGFPRDGAGYPFGWMLTHDSKATPLNRLLFAMKPLYAYRPRQLDGLRVVTVDSPEATSRAAALDVLTRAATTDEVVHAPAWVRGSPVLGPVARLWGEGLTKGPILALDPTVFDWARTDPEGLRLAAKAIASGGSNAPDPATARLRTFLDRPIYREGKPRDAWRAWIGELLRARPSALAEAVEILIARPDEVRTILLHPSYVDPGPGRYLDEGIAR